MTEEIIKLTLGALLHDLGKVVQRAGNVSGIHSKIGGDYLKNFGVSDRDILDCLYYHHGKELAKASQLSPYAYIAYIADNIAAATERRTATEGLAESGWDLKMPLQSIFNLLNGEGQRHYYRPITLDSARQGINFPQASSPNFDSHFYRDIVDRLTDSLKGFELNEAYINSFVDLAEATLSFVPSSTNKSEVADISLYDHMKLSACVAGCIYYYLEAEKEIDYKNRLFKKGTDFYSENFALLYSADISGIQDFIYTIHSEGALKSLRARSFYLELFMECLIDGLLERLGLTRANLLYAGGGHFYMLLPNTEKVKETADNFIDQVNGWLLKTFRSGLYIAAGYSPCSANTLQNNPVGSYKEIFRKSSLMVSSKKLHRYSAGEILQLNNTHAEGRECRICHSVGEADELGICGLCYALIKLSGKILKQYDNISDDEDVFFVITDAPLVESILVMESLYASVLDKQELTQMLADPDAKILRYYGKNTFYGGKKLSARLWVGDYCWEKELSKYAEQATGIKRLGVLRMDVDNLGKAFLSGFAWGDGKYNTISRTAAFSRYLSMFFKRDINMLLGSLKVTVIYSGGDDMFLIGTWDDILEAAREIQVAFSRYTQGRLTLSAGVGIYPDKYPVHVMARETGELEAVAKEPREGGAAKDAITLFTPDLCFGWDELEDVMNKLSRLKSFFANNADNKKGNAFFYQILSYIQGVEEEEKKGEASISLARYAYLLSRVDPETEDEEIKSQHRNFSKKMYAWISHKAERKQLKAAIYLHVYLTRGEE